MFNLDLHTHSTASPDGGISKEQYLQLAEDGVLDYVAITDHNTIRVALELQKIMGDKIIVGEEIMSSEGEIIGLYLSEKIRPGLSARDTMYAIRKQKGIVYIPHPLETVRKGLSQATLDACTDLIDIIEVYNARAVFQNRGPQSAVWARLHHKPVAASSDAHGIKGMSGTYTVVQKKPNRHNLVEQLKTAHLKTKRPPLYTLLYPKANRLRQRMERH